MKQKNHSVYRDFFKKIKDKLKKDDEMETYRNILKNEFRLTEIEIKAIEEIKSERQRNIFECLAYKYTKGAKERFFLDSRFAKLF